MLCKLCNLRHSTRTLASDKTVSPVSIRCQGNNACAAPTANTQHASTYCVYVMLLQIIMLLFTIHFPCSHFSLFCRSILLRMLLACVWLCAHNMGYMTTLPIKSYILVTCHHVHTSNFTHDNNEYALKHQPSNYGFQVQ